MTTAAIAHTVNAWEAGFAQALSCAQQAGRGDRRTLQGVYLEGRNGRLRFVGADGYRLCIVDTAIEVPADFEPRIYDAASVALALKALKASARDPALLAELADHRLLVSSGVTVSLVVFDGKFPPCDQLIPTQQTLEDATHGKVAVQGRYLAEAGKLAAGYGNNGAMRIYPPAKLEEPLLITWRLAGVCDVQMVVMPMNVVW